MFKLIYKNSKNSSAGFTLIELMVASAVFLILTALSTSIFIQTLRTERTLSAITAGNDSASQVLEQIAREARTGYNFGPSTSSVLTFTSSQDNNQTVGYKQVGSSIGRCVGVCAVDADFKVITPPDVNIEKLNFIYFGVNPADNAPPRITILLSVGSAPGSSSNIETNMETTVSARNVTPQ